MPKSPCFRPVTIQPMTGLLDVASDPNSVPLGGYRDVLNVRRNRDGRLCRASGWDKLFHERDPNNWDLHYQGEDYVPQHITFLYEHESPFGFRKLFAGTQNRIYALSGEGGHWQVISDLMGGPAEEGCPETRFRGAHYGRFMFFTNAKDEPVHHVVGQGLTESGGQAVAPIPDFRELNITRAKFVISFNNTVVWMNIEQDGQWYPGRVLWSDYRGALSYSPTAVESIAGFFDLDDADKIVGAAHTKNSVLIYTTTSIWEMSVSGPEGFGFTRRWRSNRAGGKAVLAFPETLVSNGDTHYYLGSDAIYEYGPYISEPRPVDWMYNAGRDIFRTIDPTRCNIHAGGYSDETDELVLSWATRNDACPSRSMVFNLRHEFASKLDHGFTCFLSHNPQRPKTLRAFMKQFCICTVEDLGSNQLCSVEEEQECEVAPESFHTLTPLVDGDITVEDYTRDSPDANSLGGLLGDRNINDFCTAEFAADECNAEKVFIAVSAVDRCLKQWGDNHYRERLVSAEGCGTYEKLGYRSRLLTGAMDLKLPDDDKIINRFAIQAHAAIETLASELNLRIGISAVAEDPNTAEGKCAILWVNEGPKLLECQGGVTAEQHQIDGTRPNDAMEWPLYQIGRYIYIELVISNPRTNDTGGAVCFSRMTFDVAAMPRPS